MSYKDFKNVCIFNKLLSNIIYRMEYLQVLLSLVSQTYVDGYKGALDILHKFMTEHILIFNKLLFIENKWFSSKNLLN